MITLSHTRLLTAGAIVTGTLVALPSAVGATPHRSADTESTFVATGGRSHNSVVVYDRRPNGSLRRAGTYSTGGAGGRLNGAQVDAVGSQGALVATARNLYTVNSGSDSLTIFHRSGDRLTDRQVLPTKGSFPVSVTVHGDLVYVLNARARGSIQGYRQTADSLTPLAGSHIALGVDTGRTPEFKTTPGQVLFSPDGRRLVVTTKNSANDIKVFSLDSSGAPAGPPATTKMNDPFGVDFDAAGHLIVSQANTSFLSSFAIMRNGALHRLATVSTGGMAACWNAAVGNMIYVPNAATSTVSEIRDTGNKLSLVGTIAGPAGTTDDAPSPDGKYLEVRGGALGQLGTYPIGAHGVLTTLQTVTVPGAVGGEGIAVATDR